MSLKSFKDEKAHSNLKFIRQPHHEKSQVCLSRPRYRDGKKKTVVKVYSIVNESVYLLVRGIPKIPGSLTGVLSLMENIGKLIQHEVLDNYPMTDSEKFTMVVLFKFQDIKNARIAKKKMDDANYMGEVLHCTYAPEFESKSECLAKLEMRRKNVTKRIKYLSTDPMKANQEEIEKFHQMDLTQQNIILRNNALSLGEVQGPLGNKMKEEVTIESVNDDVHDKLSRFVKKKFN